MAVGEGIVKTRSNKELEVEAREKELLLEGEAAALRPEEQLTLLAGALHGYWSDAKQAKMPLELRLVACKQMLEGEYTPKKLTAIRSIKGSEAYVRLAARKKRDAYSWIMDILRPSGERLWTLDPTPMPDMPPDELEDIALKITEGLAAKVTQIAEATGQFVGVEAFAEMSDEVQEEAKKMIDKAVLEEAKETMGRMAVKIEDQMVEGGWFKTFKEVVDDIVSYPAGIIKAPVLRNLPTKTWAQNEDGDWELKVENQVVPNFDRVSPWDFYPEGDAGTVDEGYLFERHRLTRKDLNALIGVPGYNEDAIREVLREYGDGGLREWLWTDTEQERLRNDGDWSILRSKRIDALEFWGSIQGKHLREYGLTEVEIPDEDLDYEINAWMIGNHVIKAVINPDKLGKKGYFPTSFEKRPGEIWGKSVPEVLEDLQGIYNSAARALANNVAIASGPQVEVDIERVQLGDDLKNIVPWKVWPSTNQMMSTSPAVRFYQPQLHAQTLVGVMEKWERLADSDSGIPSYAHGDPRVGGAGNTASGLSMMMTAAARGIKNVIQNIDIDQIGPVVGQMYDYNMQFDPDESIKGDAKVNAGGSHSVIAKEQQAMRRKDLLTITANPIDMKIMGQKGREELLRENFKSVEMDADKLIQPDPLPTEEPLEAGGAESPRKENAQLPGNVGDQGGRQDNIVS